MSKIQDCPDKGSCLNEVLIEELEANRDHWRGECRKMADKIRFIGMWDDATLAEWRELIPAAERILAELEIERAVTKLDDKRASRGEE